MTGRGSERHLTPHFTLDEVRCRCCGSLGGDEVVSNARRLAKLLEFVRAGYQRPMVVRSWYRCPAHNKAVGGVPNSYHMRGLAADIAIKSGEERYHLVRAAQAAGVERIGVYLKFVHLDIGPDPAPVLWVK